ncbi:Calcineurin-like metallo-phosphoesterase superfamily protein [Euphorbia peplus]|nr:Calcineurin-like metallo-phosphoesterase superfamily protein [Euphorbia peplus]
MVTSMAILIVVIQLLLKHSIAAQQPPLVTRIAFGSCANQSSPQPIWKAIADFDPQIFIWLGDNIYGDIRRPFKLFGKERNVGPWKNAPRFLPSSPQEMESRYHTAKTDPGYSRLRQTTKVIGTWDDHDYGLNDAGKEFEGKVTNQRLLLDFLDEPQDSPRRKQDGVYASYTFGPVNRQVKIILLDTRYHRDPLRSDGTILGVSQWTWLEKELNGPKTAITIIGSSIQVISNLSATTGPLFYLESWGRFPKERNRLFKSIADSKREGVFFISGDVHFGEISRYDCATGYPLYDVTSSGLTQAVEKVIPSPLEFIVRFVAWLTPTTMRVMNQNCRFKSCTYGQPNFGAIEVDWRASPVTLNLEIRDMNGHPVSRVKFPLLELQSQSMDSIKAGKQRRYCSLEVDLPWIKRYRLAILFYFTVSVLFIGVIGVVYAAISLLRRYLRKCKFD